MRVAIVEDDWSSAQLLQDYLMRFGREANIHINCVLYKNGLDLMMPYQHNWDLIFLDIEMPLMDGMTAARQIRKQDQEVLIMFITHMAQYAIDGYEVNALDYILKPVNYYAFAMKMRRITRLLESRHADYIVLQSGESRNKVFLNRIHYVEVYNHTLCYHTSEGIISCTGSKTIKLLEKEFFNHGFSRCHQCYLVNLYYVSKYEKNQVFVGNELLPISRNRRSRFLQDLLAYWGG